MYKHRPYYIPIASCALMFCLALVPALVAIAYRQNIVASHASDKESLTTQDVASSNDSSKKSGGNSKPTQQLATEKAVAEKKDPDEATVDVAEIVPQDTHPEASSQPARPFGSQATDSETGERVGKLTITYLLKESEAGNLLARSLPSMYDLSGIDRLELTVQIGCGDGESGCRFRLDSDDALISDTKTYTSRQAVVYSINLKGSGTYTFYNAYTPGVVLEVTI